MLRVLIADSDPASREQLRRLVEKQLDWRVCGAASSGPEAVELALGSSPHVAIVDLALRRIHGLNAVRRIKRLRPEIEILILMAHETDDLVRDLLVAGAQACLLRREVAEHLVAAVDALSRHQAYLTPRVTDAVLEVFLAHGEKQGEASRPFQLLTGREREILQLLAEGHTNGGIAGRLSISLKTVETHRSAIMKKIGAGSLAEVIRYALRNRVVEDPG
jgi:DNA-binding NarL/FixJ family response regulator